MAKPKPRFEIFRGATSPPFVATLLDEKKAAVNLTGASSIVLDVAKDLNTALPDLAMSKTLAVEGLATAGKVRYDWPDAASSNIPALPDLVAYQGMVVVTYAGGAVLKFALDFLVKEVVRR